ncbi:MAG: PD40 domain-containing protein [Prevotella sp.]|nr:PD40 domain-containing protein [Prevotella sp.]
MKLKFFSIVALASLLMTACMQPSIPTEFSQSDQFPNIYPDYIDVTIPINIAPLTFLFDEPNDGMVARYAIDGEEIVCADALQPDEGDWRQLVEKAKGGAIEVDVFSKNGEQWTRYKPFRIYVSPDSIDPYISYRLIAPSFVTYESLTINQRCLENYDESVIYDNILCGFEKDGQCINCHHYQNYNPQRMQFHARQFRGGTLIAYDGKLRKINMTNDSILSAGVYPAWHPTVNYIVYSTDKTHQSFHTTAYNKVEVYDGESDLIGYDVENNEVTNLENDSTEFEIFPCWAPDGKTLYYCSAHFERKDTSVSKTVEVLARYSEIKYNIYKKSFDPTTKRFGPRELVYDAAAHDQSATLPRVSPDGRWLLFTAGSFGCFHIWHHDADIWMIDLQTGEIRAMSEVNSPDTESYHSWSSNGRWVIISSRRYDGNFTRPFIAHVDANGKGTKPFELPSAYPDYHRQFLRSYNIPEFMRGPVTINPKTFADVLKGEATPVKYVPKK